MFCFYRLLPVAGIVLTFLLIPYFAFAQNRWTGAVNSVWNNGANWSTNSAPTATTNVQIGTVTFTNAPIIGGNMTCANITFGTVQAATLTVNGTLTINGNIVVQHGSTTVSTVNQNGTTPQNAVSNIIHTLSGSGQISVSGNVQVGNNTAPPADLRGGARWRLSTEVNTLLINGNIILNSVSNGNTGVNFPELYHQAGTIDLTGQIITRNTGVYDYAATSFTTPNRGVFITDDGPGSGSLIIRNAAVLPVIADGQVVDFTNNGSGAGRVIYDSNQQQRVYTNTSDVRIGVNNATYDILVFAGSGRKVVDAGFLSIGDSFDNSANSPCDFVSNDPDVRSYTNTNNSPGSLRIFDGGTGGTTFRRLTVTTNPALSPVSISATRIANRVNIAPNGTLTVNQSSSLNIQDGDAHVLTIQSSAAGSGTVARLGSGNSINGSVNVERYIKGSYGRSYRLLTSPVFTQTTSGVNFFTVASLKNNTFITGPNPAANGFDASSLNNPSIWVYREADAFPRNGRILDSDYKGLLTLNTPVPVGNGLLFFNRGSRRQPPGFNKLYGPFPVPEDNVITFSGSLNQQQIVVRPINNALANFTTPSAFDPNTRYYYNGSQTPASQLSFTPLTGAANASTNGFNLVGNPYAATIDLDLVTFGSTVNNNVYFYNPENKQFSYYVKGSNGRTSDGAGATRYIASGQGFFVKATAAATTSSVTFDEDDKVAIQPVPGGSPLLLMGATAKSAAETHPMIQLRLVRDSVNYDGIGIYFHPEAKAETDPLDAADLDGISPLVYLSSLSADGQRMAINMLPALDGRREVPLFVNTSASGLFSLVKTALDAIPSIYDVWLQDRYMRDSLDLRAQNSYQFRVNKTDSLSFGAGRFALLIRRKNLPPFQLLSFTAQRRTEGVELQWKVRNEFEHHTFILEKQDKHGQFISLGKIHADGSGNYTANDRNPTSDSLRYRLLQIDSEGKMINTHHALLASTKVTSPQTGFYPNPVSDVLNVRTRESRTMHIRITNTSGNILLEKRVEHDSAVIRVGHLIPGVYVLEIRGDSGRKLYSGRFVKQ